MATSEAMRLSARAKVEMTGRCRRRTLATFALLGLLSGGCTQIDNALAKVPIFAFMRDAPSFDPYEMPLPAPPGAVPFESPNGIILPPLEGTEDALNAFAGSQYARNPLAVDDPAALALGKVMYERHCAVCHGVQGRGDGPIIGPGKFPLAPTLVSGAALARNDGYMYGIIRAGRGLMPAYGTRITHTERWAIVTYVNQLQSEATTQVQPAAPAPQRPALAPTTGQ